MDPMGPNGFSGPKWVQLGPNLGQIGPMGRTLMGPNGPNGRNEAKQAQKVLGPIDDCLILFLELNQIGYSTNGLQDCVRDLFLQLVTFLCFLVLGPSQNPQCREKKYPKILSIGRQSLSEVRPSKFQMWAGGAAGSQGPKKIGVQNIGRRIPINDLWCAST